MSMKSPRAFVFLLGSLIVAMSVGPVPADDLPRVPAKWHRAHRSSLVTSGRGVASAPEVASNFTRLGHIGLGKKTKADVWLFDHGGRRGMHAYVGSWVDPCDGRGVYIVDVERPRKPTRVGRARTLDDNVSYEDPVVLRIGRRVVLAVGVQACADRGRGGLALFDVTKPAGPKLLSFFPTASVGVHELDVIERTDGTVLAALAVPFGEDSGGKDLTILDISKPRSPSVVAEIGLIGDTSIPVPSATDPALASRPEISNCCQGVGYVADFFSHSARFADGGTTLYWMPWDGGVLKYDLSDPSDPVLVGRTVYPFDADGDAHSMTTYDVGDKRYILLNDEDFAPVSPLHIETSVTGTRRYAAIEEIWMPTILTISGPVEAEFHDAGTGCEEADHEGAAGKVVLFDRPLTPEDQTCALHVPIVNAANAGAAAVIINFVGSPFGGGEVRPTVFISPGRRGLEMIAEQASELPVVAVGALDGMAAELRAASGPATVSLEPQEPSWGFLRIYDESLGEDEDGDGIVEWEQVGEFSDLPHVHQFPPPRIGSWSIHNTEVMGDRAYSSWYSHGIVALDLTDPTAPAEVGRFTPRSRKGERASVWGVAIDRSTGLIYASDEGSGLWIIRPEGDALPSTP
jgi:hypothetical protein